MTESESGKRCKETKIERVDNALRMLALIALVTTVQGGLQIGTGIWDATGPINDVLMMGMANRESELSANS